MTNPDDPEPDVDEPADALPEYEEVQVVVEGPPEAVPRRFWICSSCSSLIAGTEPARAQELHNAWHIGRMRHDM
jgi:hypothetical protein